MNFIAYICLKNQFQAWAIISEQNVSVQVNVSDIFSVSAVSKRLKGILPRPACEQGYRLRLKVRDTL